MDAYDYEQIDKEMSKRLDAIYRDPSRHKFYSCYDEAHANGAVGPRGGRVRARKTICAFCGQKRKGHAQKTENL